MRTGGKALLGESNKMKIVNLLTLDNIPEFKITLFSLATFEIPFHPSEGLIEKRKLGRLREKTKERSLHRAN